MKIDFVIPWVDGGDPVWRKERRRYSNDPRDSDECRFRDWDLLRFWFRAVEVYAPWVNRVHFVTWKQVPDWMNREHPKLHLVDHQDFIPAEYLPTFSSHTIELNFHRIPGLAEHFVYFNDDMFLNAPVTPEDFFVNSVPCDRAVLDQFAPMSLCDPYTHAQCNVIGFLNLHFNKHTVLLSNPGKWFSLKYGKGFLKNLYYALPKNFSNFNNQHIPSCMLRSVYEQVWALEPDLLHNTCCHKFRQLGDVNQYIMSYYNMCLGNFVPRPYNFGRCYSIGSNNDALYRDIQQGIHKTICINDHPNILDFNGEKLRLLSLFNEKFLQRSSFEL